ncbi:hypothetical protein [Gluconobacter morbifer]|uniref:DUF2125 domain-containing protein n=1 Tax=Gluconobacter morbifer G707 TaxID=1088869 RepID=G6XI99_9PROT|nr:hypothetical protein [Gluconobacter morbifer]EHH68539.1 hypothetical protein GMO_13090 [Gluconobacter morbifer G707]
MIARILCLAALAATLPLSGIAHARADTLSPIPESCFTYTLASPQPSAHGLAAGGMHATLTGTGITLDVHTLSLNDPQGKVDGDSLRRFNAAAAYAALTAFRGGNSGACQNRSLTTDDAHIHGGTPQATWTGVTLARPGHDMTISRATIAAVETTPDLRLRVSGTGVHDSKQPLIPSQVSADMTLLGNAAALREIVINSAHAVSGSSVLDGHGTIEPGPSAAATKADGHLSVTNVSDLLTRLRETAPKKVYVALSIAHLMGRQNGNATEWDLGLDSGVATVNRVPLPISLPH